jgi:CheY-like chemotaxis protein
VERITVLIADDHPVVRQGLRTFLELQDDIEVAGEAGDGAEAAAQAERLRAQTAPAQPAELSGAQVTSPGLGSATDPDAVASAQQARPDGAAAAGEPSALQRPEVLAGIAFGGAFLAARILKRLFD